MAILVSTDANKTIKEENTVYLVMLQAVIGTELIQLCNLQMKYFYYLYINRNLFTLNINYETVFNFFKLQ